MKIHSIDTFPVKLKLRHPFRIANVVNHDMYYVIIRVTSDCGITGWGEAVPAWEVTGETQFSVIDTINHLCDPSRTGITLIGQDISDLEAVRLLMRTLSPDKSPAPFRGAPSAKAAFEEAVFDACARAAGVPVHSLFDAENAPVPFNRVISILPVNETLEKIEEAVSEGAEVIKVKTGINGACGLSGFERDIAVIRHGRRIIENSGRNILFAADANQGYATPETTIELCRRIEGCLDWLEQPILADNLQGFRLIKEHCSVPLMADESVQGYRDAKALLEDGGVDSLNLKLMKTGGMLEALRIADLACEYGVKCQMGSMLENQIGTAMCAHAFLCHENIVSSEIDSWLRLRECIGTGMKASQQTVELPHSPGIGVDVNIEDVLRHIITGEDSATLAQARRGFSVPLPAAGLEEC